MDYDRFIRERADTYGPSIMSYGDSESINRYLGLGSLRPNTSNVGGLRRNQGKSQGICWRYNGLGKCRQSCRFRHACGACGEPHPKIECPVASHSQGSTQTQGTVSSGGGQGSIRR